MNSNQKVNFGLIENSSIQEYYKLRIRPNLNTSQGEGLSDCTPHNVWANIWWKYEN